MELNNGLVCVEFDDATGSLRQMRDLKAGREHLRDPRGSRLFKLVVSAQEEMSKPVYSHQAGRPTMRRQGPTLEIAYPQLMVDGQPTGLAATVTVRLPEGSPEATFSVRIANDGPLTVHEVWFPCVGGWNGLAGKGVDALHVGGMLKVDPHEFPVGRAYTFGRCHQRRWFGSGTGHLLPFLDLSGGGTGISLCSYARVPRIHGWVLENLTRSYDELCLSLAWVGQPFVKPGQAWQSPEIGLGMHQGDWHETADRVRRFIEGWWTAPPIPARLRRAIGFFNVFFRGFNGEHYHDFEEIPAIVRDIQRYGVSDLCLWDCIAGVYLRPDTGGFWEAPPERLAALREGLAQARRLGCNTSTLVNLRLVVERNQIYPQLAPELQRSLYGQPLYDSWPCGLHHAQYRNPNLEQGGRPLCQSSPRFREFALDVVKRTLDLGFTSLFLDQTTEFFLCFADNHGHVSPDDTPERAYEWIAEAARMVRSRNEEAYLIGELPELFNTQLVDLWWEWQQRSMQPQGLRYVLPQSLQSWVIDENERDVIARAFAMGCLLALNTREFGGLLSDEPELAAHVARLARLRQDTAAFVAEGRFRDDRGLTLEGGEGYVYTSPAGLAVTLANPSSGPCTVRAALDPQVLGKTPMASGRLHIEDGTVLDVPSKRAAGGLGLEAVLPPFGAAVWCLPCKNDAE